MEKHGYKKPMSLGPILGSGGLAMIIPPSAMAVLLGALASINVGRLLIAGIIPGLIIAFLYSSYVIIRCLVQPSLAPAYSIEHTPLSEKLLLTAKYVLPVGLIIFLVLGVIFLGIATPSEAAATGTVGTFILAVAYRRMNLNVLKNAFIGSLNITVMIFTIIAGAAAFGQILSLSGASRGFVQWVATLPLSPILLVIAMQFVALVLGTFMSIVPVMMITLPIFMPIVLRLGFDPVWFGLIMLINLEMSTTTPPFGMLLYVMKGSAPQGTTMKDVIFGALPFLFCDLVAIIIFMFFPSVVLWLPSIMV
jgi:tripartite ATP-independent transporter DctM subunit